MKYLLLSFLSFCCLLNAYQHELSVTAIFRDEAPYLREWIEYHKLLGVEHFYLYNNLSQDKCNEVLAPYVKNGEVDLIEWPESWSPGITLASSISHGNINWSTINSQIAKGNPVIVHINKTNGAGGHYVVITGKDSKDYIVHDPYFGPNLYLGTSKSLMAKMGKDSGVTVDQMIIYN